MTIKDISDAMETGKVSFGLKQALRNSKKKSSRIFVVRDVRDSTSKSLKSAKVDFDVLKPKEIVKRELNLNFDCEVFSIC